MRLIERMRSVFLRWDNALLLITLAIPFVLAAIAGFLWLSERGWLLPFIGGFVGINAVVALARFGVGRLRARTSSDAPAAQAAAHVRADPEWTQAEQDAFSEACDFIAASLKEPKPWEDLQPLALDVVDIVARASGRKNKGRLDFTVPEGLLLVERVASRFRADIRSYVPMADTISVAALEKIWRHREMLRNGLRAGQFAWRAARVIRSLPTAILREIESAIAQGHTNALTGEGTAAVQAILLEEVASAAVDLYSGRLRFSDSELLDLRAASGETDRDRLAEEDAPVRIAIAGQVSAGKSSLINALIGEDLAETDVVATTDKPATYEIDWNGVPCMLLDLPGLDGSARARAAVLAELEQSDLIVWVLRANRPAREIDRSALEDHRASFAANPERRAPPLLSVVTGIDTVLDGWPYPENLLPPEALTEVSRIVEVIAGEIDCENPIPVVLTSPLWNLETLRAQAESKLVEALMAQRNRVRTTASRTGVTTEITRAGRGVVKGLTTFGPKLLQGRKRDPKD